MINCLEFENGIRLKINRNRILYLLLFFVGLLLLICRGKGENFLPVAEQHQLSFLDFKAAHLS